MNKKGEDRPRPVPADDLIGFDTSIGGEGHFDAHHLVGGLNPFDQFFDEASNVNVSDDPFEFLLKKAKSKRGSSLPEESSSFSLNTPTKFVDVETPKKTEKKGKSSEKITNCPETNRPDNSDDKESTHFSAQANEYIERLKKLKEFYLRNSPNTPKLKRQTQRFSILNSALLDNNVSFNLLDDSIFFENSVLQSPLSTPQVQRRSMSVGNLTTTKEFPPFEIIKSESQKMCQLLESSQLFTSKNKKEAIELLADEISSFSPDSPNSSEDEIGLPKLRLSTPNLHDTSRYLTTEESNKYKQLTTSILNSSQSEGGLNSTYSKESEGDKNRTFEIENDPPKAPAKSKLIQLGINNIPKGLKPLRKGSETILQKKGPIKAFSATTSQKPNSSISRPTTAPLGSKILNDFPSRSSSRFPKATSTPDKPKGIPLTHAKRETLRPTRQNCLQNIPITRQLKSNSIECNPAAASTSVLTSVQKRPTRKNSLQNRPITRQLKSNSIECNPAAASTPVLTSVQKRKNKERLSSINVRR